jgi:hypothetical protein
MSFTHLLKKSLTLLASAIVAVCFIGCGLVAPHDTKDAVEITPQSTGELAIASMTEQDSLAATLSTAGSGLECLSIEKKFSVNSAVKLAKQAMTTDKPDAASITWNLTDTSNGIARLTLSTHTPLVDSYDTILIRWDDYAKDAIPNNEHIISISGEKEYIGGKSERYSVTDADNDGILLDKSKPSSQVDIVLFQKNPPLKPFVDSLSLRLRMIIDGNDSNAKLIRLSGEEYRVGGRIITVNVADIHGNLDVMPFDTAVATYAINTADPNGVKDSVKFVFDVQSGLQNSHDNLLYELYIRKQHPDGAVTDRTFHFVTTQAVREGEKPTSGHFTMTVSYNNGKNASITGDFTETGFTGVWTGPNGNTVTITWDKNSDTFSSN